MTLDSIRGPWLTSLKKLKKKAAPVAHNSSATTHQLIASLRQSNPDLREIGHDEDIRVNGMAAKSVDMIGTSPGKVQGGRAVSERDWLVTFQRSDGNLLYLVFISPDQDFGKLRPTFEEMLKSVHLK